MQRKLWKRKAGNIMTGLKVLTVLLLLVLSMGNAAKAQEPVFPVPAGNPAQLFYLQRTPNSNTIVCELRYDNGAVDTTNPVHVFWIRYGEQGQRAELSFIQRKFAYGVNAKKVATDKYELHFVSYKKYSMYLMKGADQRFHVYAQINKKWAILNRIYIKIKEGGSFWSPNIEHVELHGADPASGEEVMEKMKV